MKALKLSMYVVLFIALFGCSDDESKEIGELCVRFNVTEIQTTVRVYALGYEQQALFSMPVTEGLTDVAIDLNSGNYMIVPEDKGKKVTVQIMPGRTTSIVYDSKGTPAVTVK